MTAAWAHALSFACALSKSLHVGGCISTSLLSIWPTVCSLPDYPSAKYSVYTSCSSFVSRTIGIHCSLSRLVWSVPFIFNIYRASSVYCLISARWTTSKSTSCSWKSQPSRLLQPPAKISNSCKSSWFLQVMNQLFSTYGHSNSADQTTVSYPLRGAAILCSALASMPDQYSDDWTAPSFCDCSRMHFSYELHWLVSTVH